MADIALQQYDTLHSQQSEHSVAAVEIRGLRKEFGESIAIPNLNLDIQMGELVTLVGPSGCGKTTTLRCLAGLEVPTRGSITVGGNVLVDAEKGRFVPPENRDVGMVFQSYALWPHMTVAGNVAYPLRANRTLRADVGPLVSQALNTVGLGGLSDRYPGQLSGGQQQRVALARALVTRGDLLLFDEPLSNLDAKLRVEMRGEIRKLHDEVGRTSIYVTHDREEALSISDYMVVMNDGGIAQVGKPAEVYERPESAFVADFMGVENVLAVTREGGSNNMPLVPDGKGGRVRLREHANYRSDDVHGLWLTTRARDLRLFPAVTDETVRDTIRGRVLQQQYLGDGTLTLVDLNGTTLTIHVPVSQPRVDNGALVDIEFPSTEKLRLIAS